MCGTHLAHVCASCGYANPLNYQFCSMCGVEIERGRVSTDQQTVEVTSQRPGESLGFNGSPELPISIIPKAPTPVEHLVKNLEGERRIATVILADVKNSTDLMEHIGSEAWVEIMNRVFQILESEIYRFGGTVDQFRGDGLVAFFGATLAHEDDPERAVLAALYMQRAIKRYSTMLVEQQGIDLQLRIGVNTGEVIVASIGDTNQHWEDTTMGEAVALASRMETAAEPGTVLVSENTYRLAEVKFLWESLGEMSVKGIGQLVRVYRPLNPQAEAEWINDLSDIEILTPPTGRASEYQSLVRCVEDLSGGRGGIVLVIGEKGMGKSYLVNQVRNRFLYHELHSVEVQEDTYVSVDDPLEKAYQPPLTWLRGNCRSYDQSLPFALWLDVLQRWLGVEPKEPNEDTRLRLHQKAEILWGEDMERYYPYLATFLGLPIEAAFSERVRYLDAQALQRQFFMTIRSWIEALARVSPLVLALADLHWVDSTSLELLKYCLPLCDNMTLLCVFSFRPERASPAWEFRHFIETDYPHKLSVIDLQPLTEIDSCELIERLVGSGVLSKKTNEEVLSKAEGNPYYIQEIIHALIAQGILKRNPQTGNWVEERPVTSLDLPDSLQNLLLAHIDRLSTETRHVFQMAAVIGPLFWFNVLSDLANDSELLKEHLTSLQRHGLIQEHNPIPELGMEYAFNSSLMREVAYESLLKSQRSSYHLKVADFLENCVELENWTRYNGLIAHHFQHAGNHAKELLFVHKAAEQARAVYANAEALGYYNRALDLLDDMEAQASSEGQLFAIRTQRFEVLNHRGQIHYLLGNFQDGNHDCHALLNLARHIADHPAWLIDALLVQPESSQPQDHNELHMGLQMASEALTLSQQLGDRSREMKSLIAVTGAKILLNDHTWYEDGGRALNLARELKDQQAEMQLLLGLGNIYGMDDLKRSLEYLEAALSVTHQTDDKLTEMQLLQAIGSQYERSGDYSRLLTDYLYKWLQISREIGNRLAEGDALMYIGEVQASYLGDYEGGLALEQESLRIWEGATKELFPLLRVAQILSEIDRYNEAEVILERAGPIVDRMVHNIGRAGFDLVSAILCNSRADEFHLRKALEHTDKVIQMVTENLVSRQYRMAAASEASSAHLELAKYAINSEERQSHISQALTNSQVALDLYLEFGFLQIVECVSEEILFRHSRALKANNRYEEAAEYLKKAHGEMMRKMHLIPANSPFRKSFMENIHIHHEIRQAFAVLVKKALGGGGDET